MDATAPVITNPIPVVEPQTAPPPVTASPPPAVLSIQFVLLGLDRPLLLWPWAGYVGLIAVVALIVKGFQKRFSSVNVVVTALEIGTIESQMITRLEAVPVDVYGNKAAETA